MDKTIGELEKIDITTHSDKNDIFLPVYSKNSDTQKMTLKDLLENLWDQMYINTKKVIITCSYCLSANAITNSNCIQCGAPLGKDIEKS